MAALQLITRREIDFICFNASTKQLINLKAITPLATEIPGLFLPERADYTLLQYTGFDSFDGKKIYDGHIITKGTDDHKFRVYWHNEKGQWYMASKDGDDFGTYTSPLRQNNGHDQQKGIRIIGHVLIDGW